MPGNDVASSPCARSEEHTSELQSLRHLVCRLLLDIISISVEQTAEEQELKVEGRIAGPWAAELGRVLVEAALRLSSRILFIDRGTPRHPLFPLPPPLRI